MWKAAATVAAFAALLGTESVTAQPTPSTGAQTSGSDKTAALKVGYFTRGPVTQVAQNHNFFSDEHLKVEEIKTAGSTVLFKNLRDGVWDIGLNVADNDFQFRLNPANPLGSTFDAVIFARLDNGTGASLMARPQIKSCSDARGKTFAVDAPGSGYAYIGYEILKKKCGFEPERDYQVKITGGTDKRYADLVNNVPGSDLVVVHTGLPELAEAKGMQRFGSMFPDATDAYTGGVATATRRWLDSHGDVAVRFLRAMNRATDYVVDPAHKAEILTLLPSDNDPRTAERIYDMFVHEGSGGLIRGLGLDVRGLAATARLREEWHGWDQPQNIDWLASEKSGVFDMSYRNKAVLEAH